MKIKLILSILVIIISSCNSSSTEGLMKENKINIIGKAYNGKGGALIITETNETYYIEGLDSWEDSMLEKNIEITGYIYSENFKEEDLKDETGAWKQGMIGEKLSVKKAKWKLSDK